MINTISIIDGFKVLLGSVPIHFSLLITMAIEVSIPKCEETDKHDECRVLMPLYLMALITHIIIFVVGIITNFYAGDVNRFLEQFHIVAILVQVSVLVYICDWWVFNDEIIAKMLTETRPTWLLFDFWMRIELLVFMSLILSNIAFLFFRSFTISL